MEQSKILLIDDEVSTLKLMISIFEEYCPNYIIYQSRESVKALNIATDVLPDIIITDWVMPEMTGIELIEKLKKDPVTESIPVLITTAAMSSPENLKSALEIGAVDFIKKPFNPVEFIARVTSAIQTSVDHKVNIETMNKELIENRLFLVKNNEFLMSLSENLQTVSDECNNKSKKTAGAISQIIEDIQSKVKEDSWQKFIDAFDKINNDFSRRLINQFPALKMSELKLCFFIKLGLSNSEIASILYNTPESIKVARSRLRKKLNLSGTDNLQTFLASI